MSRTRRMKCKQAGEQSCSPACLRILKASPVDRLPAPVLITSLTNATGHLRDLLATASARVGGSAGAICVAADLVFLTDSFFNAGEINPGHWLYLLSCEKLNRLNALLPSSPVGPRSLTPLQPARHNRHNRNSQPGATRTTTTSRSIAVSYRHPHRQIGAENGRPPAAATARTTRRISPFQ